MDANEYALAHGVRRTRESLSAWSDSPAPVLGSWLLGAVLISSLLLVAVLLVATFMEPDIGFEYVPGVPSGTELDHVANIVARNSVVLALHAVACIAGFIAGSSLALGADKRKGLSRWVHERARPVAFAWVIAVTSFSLLTQAFALGSIGSTLAYSAGVSPAILVLTALPHALLELTAVFLPLAAWTIASRKDEWDQLLAATLVTVTMAIPMLLIAASWEVHIWPHLLRAAAPGL